MKKSKLRKPAALAASLALVFAISACTDDDNDPDPTGTTVPGATTTLVPDATTTTLAG
ncbi:MAG TPA: hypothetical protein VFZ15_11055 [Acidimicrobiia bacterium]|nr:hypothetical protein [Acidimicrobiia bacterium]